MNRGIAALAVCALVALPLAGCGDDGDQGSGPSGSAGEHAATEQPQVDVGPIEAPADYTEIEGSGFTIAAPGEFQQQTSTSPNGEPRLVLEKPSQVPQVPQRVVVIRDVDPEQDAEEQSYVLESFKAGPEGGDDTDVHRYRLDAPEGQASFLITWNEPQAAGGGSTVSVTYWQLMYQVDEHLILNVVAFAPAAEFESSEVSRILRTFEPGSAA